MAWLVALDSLLWIAAVVLFFAGYGWFALICAILAAILLLVISGGKSDLSDIFDIFD
jgi:hypothetical protein